MTYENLLRLCEANDYIRRSMRAGSIGLRQVDGEWRFSVILISNCKQKPSEGWDTLWHITDMVCKNTRMVNPTTGYEYVHHRVAIKYIKIMLDMTFDELLEISKLYGKDMRVNLRAAFKDWEQHKVRPCAEMVKRDTRSTVGEVREISRMTRAQSLLRAAGF